ncbi:MAG: hypothetical protein DMG98_10155 [Acidobacteria bacterium]|nr:MAG: hypothetical protein DMG98_10155 [Acidobacteriota bacterium]
MSIRFADDCQKLETHLKTRYGIRVVTRDIPDPLTGDPDGLEIHIDYAVTPEQRLFLLAHLFGHTVQWNTDPGAFEIGRKYQPPVDEGLFTAILAYENEAASYGLAMLHQAGIADADEWFSAYSQCDQIYLLDFYRSGKKGDFRTFWPASFPLIQPKPIPSFQAVRRGFRMDGVGYLRFCPRNLSSDPSQDDPFRSRAGSALEENLITSPLPFGSTRHLNNEHAKN